MKGLEYIVKEFKIDYKEVARVLGISPSTINDWVNKDKKIPEKRLEQLSPLFSCPKTYFQKELTFTEMAEVRLQYLKHISEEYDVPVSNEEGEVVSYHKQGTYEEEIQFLRNLIDEKIKQNGIRNGIEDFMKNESILITDELDTENKEPLLLDSSNTETLNKIISVMADGELANKFKVIVHLLNYNDEFGGKPISKVSQEYRDFARDFSELLKKHKIKN